MRAPTQNLRSTSRLPAWALVVLAAAGPALTAGDPRPEASGEALKGEALKVEDATFTPIKLPAKELTAFLCWGDPKGETLLALEAHGVLREVAVPEFKEVRRVDLDRKCSSLAVSAEGLVVTLYDTQQVWVLDREKLVVKHKIDVPTVTQAAAAPGSSVAVATSREGLTVIDLKKGAGTPVQPKAGDDTPGHLSPAMTPDGTYLFTRSKKGEMYRFRVADGALRFEEVSHALGDAAKGIQISPDSKYVCLPTPSGNSKGLKDHPQPQKRGVVYTYVYPVEDIRKPAFAMDHAGPYPAAVGFDPAAGLVYAHNSRAPVIVLDGTGMKKKEYKMGFDNRQVRQLLAHPSGNKLLVLVDELYWVELPPPER